MANIDDNLHGNINDDLQEKVQNFILHCSCHVIRVIIATYVEIFYYLMQVYVFFSAILYFLSEFH